MPQVIEFEKYLRVERLPFIWCTGCGNGIVLKALLGAVDRLGWDQDSIAMVSGIGCSSRATGYVDFNTLHTTHGRAIGFASGLKLARPELHVVVLTGDGDATAIGGNHFIHAARRNLDITVVLFNNWIYGMTGGQLSPTTPHDLKATTASFGNIEASFDISRLAVAAGASFVARVPVTSPIKMSKFIEQGLTKKGFSLIEAFTPCPTAFGRQNKIGSATSNMTWIKDRTVELRDLEKLDEREREDKLVTGILVNVEKPEYTALYAEVKERLGQNQGAGPRLPERRNLMAADCIQGGESI